MNTRRADATLVGLSLAAVLVGCSSGGTVSPAAGAKDGATERAATSAASATPVAVDHTVIDVGFAPHRLTVADGSVWVAGGAGAVHRVAVGATRSHLVGDTKSALSAVAVSRGRVFAGDNRGSRLLVVDATTGRRLQAVQMPGPVRGVLAGLGAVWVAAGSKVVRLDPRTLAVGSVTEVGGEVAQLAIADRSVLVSNRTLSTIARLDVHGRLQGTADVGGPTIGLAVTNNLVFATRSDRPAVAMLNREHFSYFSDAELPGVSYAAAVVGSDVWLTLVDLESVVRLSGAGDVLELVQVGRRPLGLAVAGGSVWVANEGESTLWRLPANASTVGT